MSPEKTKGLIALYPEMFRGKSFLFECGDGWCDLLKRCILGIREDDLLNQRVTEVTQVKEKYGTLRFYVCSSSEEVDRIICAAKHESSKTCEFCGDLGMVNKEGYWKSTLCDSCREEKSSG